MFEHKLCCSLQKLRLLRFDNLTLDEITSWLHLNSIIIFQVDSILLFFNIFTN